jgi:carbamoyl-phosphate synthase large subunit
LKSKAHPQIDAVSNYGGQTALNLCLKRMKRNLARLWSKMIGVDVNAINITENREQFKQLLKKKGVPSALQKYVLLTLEEKNREFGFPLVIRPSFTLGGTGAIVYKRRF